MEGDRWMEIRNDYKKGLSYTEIGLKHNIDWRTAKKYAHSDHKPKYELKAPKPSKLDPYKQQIDLMAKGTIGSLGGSIQCSEDYGEIA